MQVGASAEAPPARCFSYRTAVPSSLSSAPAIVACAFSASWRTSRSGSCSPTGSGPSRPSAST
eukprot:12580996-Alexandrium_andersonii.AAC.1